MSLRDAIDCRSSVTEPSVAANVQGHGDVRHPGSLENVNRSIEDGGRKVLDTVKAQIFKRFYCLAQAGTGEPRDKDDAQRTHMKLFSPERANALISRLEPLIEELLSRRRELAIKLLESDPALQHANPARSRLAGMRSPLPAPRFGEFKHEIGRLIYRIESYGCIVKDIDLGLIDFPSMRDDEPIFLCWKFGEPEVAYWHGTDEGFTTRKALI
jgi:hypothetical protein